MSKNTIDPSIQEQMEEYGIAHLVTDNFTSIFDYKSRTVSLIFTNPNNPKEELLLKAVQKGGDKHSVTVDFEGKKLQTNIDMKDGEKLIGKKLRSKLLVWNSKSINLLEAVASKIQKEKKTHDKDHDKIRDAQTFLRNGIRRVVAQGPGAPRSSGGILKRGNGDNARLSAQQRREIEAMEHFINFGISMGSVAALAGGLGTSAIWLGLGIATGIIAGAYWMLKHQVK